MLHGLQTARRFDDKRFWPIYARAETQRADLSAPGLPHAGVIEPPQGLRQAIFPDSARRLGYTVETATLAIRMVLSGVFDKIRGHVHPRPPRRETLPFLVWRADMALGRPGARREAGFRDVFCRHFCVTTSGFFSNPALLTCVMELGIDRILFAVDWPFVANTPGTRWLESVPLSDEDKAKILSGNAKRLLRM